MVVFDAKGKFVRSWGKEFRGVAHGLHIRKEGQDEFLYLTVNAANPKMTPPAGDAGGRREDDAEGRDRLEDPGAAGHRGLPARRRRRRAKPYNPTNVAIAPNGDIYVGDGYGSYYVNQYDSKAEYIRTFGGKGSEPGKLAEPHGIWVDHARRDARSRRRRPSQQPAAALHARRQAHRLRPGIPAAVPLRRTARPGRHSRSAGPRHADRSATTTSSSTSATRTPENWNNPLRTRAARQVHPRPVHLPARRLLRPRRQHLRRRVGRGRTGDQAAEGLAEVGLFRRCAGPGAGAERR